MRNPLSTVVSVGELYERAPRWVHVAAVAGMGAYLRWQRNMGEFVSLLADCEAATFADTRELKRRRERAWNERMREAVAQVAAYGGQRLALDDVATTLPVITKADVRGNAAAFVRPGVPAWRRVGRHTSGTTGAGLSFVASIASVRREYAFVWRYRGWHGIRPGEHCATFGGRPVVSLRQRDPPYWAENPVGHSTLYSQYHLNERTVRAYLEHLRATRVRWIHGYPATVALLSRLAIAAGLARSTHVRWVTVSSENLLDQQRRDIEAMFGVQPRQQYGSIESVAMISECPEGRLHLDDDYSFVELLPCERDRSRCRIVGTTLANDAFPLVRYDLGDVVAVPAEGETACGCGRSGRVVSAIDGRYEDYLVLADGSLLGLVDLFFKDAVHLEEAQVVQRRPGAAIVRVVRGPDWSVPDEAAIRREIRHRAGALLEVEFEYVESIPRTAAGKLRMVVREDGAAAPSGGRSLPGAGRRAACD